MSISVILSTISAPKLSISSSAFASRAEKPSRSSYLISMTFCHAFVGLLPERKPNSPDGNGFCHRNPSALSSSFWGIVFPEAVKTSAGVIV